MGLSDLVRHLSSSLSVIPRSALQFDAPFTSPKIPIFIHHEGIFCSFSHAPFSWDIICYLLIFFRSTTIMQCASYSRSHSNSVYGRALSQWMVDIGAINILQVNIHPLLYYKQRETRMQRAYAEFLENFCRAVEAEKSFVTLLRFITSSLTVSMFPESCEATAPSK